MKHSHVASRSLPITLLLITLGWGVEPASGVYNDDSSSSSSEGESTTDKDKKATSMGGLSKEIVTTPKRKLRVRGNFKGKDPMIAPDGESALPPTDGSRPKGQ